MSVTLTFNMTATLSAFPYTSIYWQSPNAPDNLGVLSGFYGMISNIAVDSVTQVNGAVNPLTLVVGGDLSGSLPNPSVSSLQGKPISVSPPTAGQVLQWSGSTWTPSTPLTFPASISAPTITQNTQTSNIAANPIIIQPQAPYASATGPNRNTSFIIFNTPAPVSGGSRGGVGFWDGGVSGAPYFAIQSDGSNNTSFAGGGKIAMSCSSTITLNSVLAVGGNTLGFFGIAAAPITQPSRVNQLTDNTGGAVTTTLAAGISDTVAKNAIASLAAKVNALELIIHNLGLSQ